MRFISFFFIVFLTLAGCKELPDSNKTKPAPENLKEKISFYYEDWKGTKYAYGGNSKKGIDCSAFTMNFYNNFLNYSLPRTTKAQLEKGEEIKKNELKMGDLVFFKTSKRNYHVGIYYKDGEFIHASTSKGVMISKLDNPYWKSKYLEARRLIDQA